MARRNVRRRMIDDKYTGVEEESTHRVGDETGGQEKKDVEVLVNGHDGPSIKFRIGLIAITQIVIAAITLGGASAILRADVDHMKAETAKAAAINEKILTSVTKLESEVGYLRDEVRYYRERIDKMQEGRRGQ